MKKIIILVSLFVLIVGSGTVLAQRPVDPPIDPPPQPIPPQPIPPQPIPPEPIPPIRQHVVLAQHRVDATVEDQVATTRIMQEFRNDSDFMAEGVYIFPLPRGASVSDLVMFVDGEPIPARILDADEARATYEQIVRSLRDPALLEYIGQDAIQASVFPIQPRDSVRIEIEYSHILPVEDGLVRYEYPLRVDQLTDLPVENTSISVEVTSNDEIGAIYSPSHHIAVSRESDFRFRAGYEDSDSVPTGNFTLYYSLANELIDVNLLTYRASANEDGFFLLLVAPPNEVAEADIQPRDIILVLDQSGSMDGDKWQQAREAAQFVLANLNPRDRFNVIAFSTGLRLYANDLQDEDEAPRASDWLDTLAAVGGTDINAALQEAFRQADDARQTTVLFLTDGLPTEGIVDTGDILRNAQAEAPDNVRIFTFGVGDDVDTFLLDQLTQNLSGTGVYVRPDERIDEEVTRLYNRIAAPVMTDIALDFGAVVISDTYPAAPLPDLFVGSQLIVAGRYRDSGTTTLTLSGVVNGQRTEVVYGDLRFPENAGGEASIPRLWATRKIGALLTSIRLNGENPELVDSIVDLSVRYGIITPYTSFFIDENDIFTAQGRDEMRTQAQTNLGVLDDTASGAAAVDAADSALALEEAEAPPPAPSAAMPNEPAMVGDDFDADGAGQGGAIQIVGDRTFVWQNGIWIDTTYDADTMTPEVVIFLSDAYFDLLDTYPEIGPYLALGDHLIVVVDGQAYEIQPE